MKKKLSLTLVLVAYLFSFNLSLTKKNNAREESSMSHHELTNIATINPRIKLDIRYATTNNFTNQIIYPLHRCYLKKFVAEKLHKIQQELEPKGFGLKIFDGYRPKPYQQKLWDVCPNSLYVADPKKGSSHSRGVAVDLTLVDIKTGDEVEMPSGFDDFTEKAHRIYENMVPEARRHCKILEDIMVKHGFKPYHGEWWHYADASWQNHPLLDITFEELEKR